MKGCVAFVTGGAKGIGRATVEAFVALGVNVAAIDIDEEALRETVAACSASGSKVVPIVADLADTSRLDGSFNAAVAEFGRVDYLVNCAAIVGGTLDFLAVEQAEWKRFFRVNVNAPMVLMQTFARHAISRGGGGRIVNVTSSSAFRALRTRPAYGSTKGALGTLTRIAAAQLGEHDINVNAVAPGLTNTPGAIGAVGDKLRQSAAEGPNANFFKRLSEPEDVSATITFLCSPGARQITGQTIHVSAGTITP